jgi:isopentenyl-diphosphate delta-isomerase
MGLVRLDGYLPVRIGDGMVLCAALAPDAAELHVPPGTPLAETCRADFLCHEGLTVHATVRAASYGGSTEDGLVRVTVDLLEFEGSGEEELVGHILGLRKASHLNVAATQDVESAVTRAGWDGWRLPHVALPEVHPDELDLSVSLLGATLAAPFMIAGMTGGSRRAGLVNRRLAEAAQELGLAMGLGSQRAMLESPSLAPTFAVRDVAPDILLVGNIGAVQLNLGVSIDDCRSLVDAVGADALALHLNPLQEMVQPEGDRDWRELLPRIEALCAALEVPVLAKETGCGISAAVALQLRDVGVAAIDVGGTGGTAWGWIEGFRSASEHRQQIGATFREWGIPTADAVIQCRAALGDRFPIVSTGGVRTGLDVATALALGADVAGMALPFFRAADQSVEAVVELGRRLIEELRIAVFCSGAGSAAGLRGLATRPGEAPS